VTLRRSSAVDFVFCQDEQDREKRKEDTAIHEKKGDAVVIKLSKN